MGEDDKKEKAAKAKEKKDKEEKKTKEDDKKAAEKKKKEADKKEKAAKENMKKEKVKKEKDAKTRKKELAAKEVDSKKVKEQAKKETASKEKNSKASEKKLKSNVGTSSGSSWCETFHTCARGDGRNFWAWVKGQGYKQYKGACATSSGSYGKRHKYWGGKHTFYQCKDKCDSMGAKCQGFSMPTSIKCTGGPKVWKDTPLTCITTTKNSNRAGVIKPATHGGYTMVGGGMNNHYRHWKKIAAFEESMPDGNQWRCDTGFGPGRLTCYSRQCKMQGMACTTVSKRMQRSGVAHATLPAGYVVTGGGVYNHYRSFNKKAAFEESFPANDRTWQCDMGIGAGDFTCYARGCKNTATRRLVCLTQTSGNGNHHTVNCPSGYSITGCGQNELRRRWDSLSGFEEMRIHGNGCVCDSGFGGGNNRCYARCCKMQSMQAKLMEETTELLSVEESKGKKKKGGKGKKKKKKGGAWTSTWTAKDEANTKTTKAVKKGNKKAAKKAKAAAKVAKALAKARLTFDKLAGKAASLKELTKVETQEAKDIKGDEKSSQSQIKRDKAHLKDLKKKAKAKGKKKMDLMEASKKPASLMEASDYSGFKVGDCGIKRAQVFIKCHQKSTFKSLVSEKEKAKHKFNLAKKAKKEAAAAAKLAKKQAAIAKALAKKLKIANAALKKAQDAVTKIAQTAVKKSKKAESKLKKRLLISDIPYMAELLSIKKPAAAKAAAAKVAKTKAAAAKSAKLSKKAQAATKEAEKAQAAANKASAKAQADALTAEAKLTKKQMAAKQKAFEARQKKIVATAQKAAAKKA